MSSSIYAQHAQCRVSFDALFDALKHPIRCYGDDIPMDGVGNESDRFAVWAGSLGAQLKPEKRASLDFRLRESEFYKDQVLELLVDLQETLTKATELLRDERKPNEERDSDVEQDSNSDSSEKSATGSLSVDEEFGSTSGLSSLGRLRFLLDSRKNGKGTEQDSEGEVEHSQTPFVSSLSLHEMSQLYEAIQDIIRSLYKIAGIIRRPIPTDQLARASSIPMSEFDQFDRQHVEECFPNASLAVQNRLATSITRRRQLLKYNERHYSSLSQPEKQETEPEQKILATRLNQPALSISQSFPQRNGDKRRPASSAIATSIVPSTEATRFVPPEDSQNVEVQSEGGSESSYAFSESTREKIRIPPRPRDPDGFDMDQFLCPLCFHLVEIKTTRAWTRHVFRDLQAYVCTHEDCQQPNKLFGTRNEWFQHEIQLHRREWHCNIAAHPTQTSREEFETHIRQHHPAEATEAQLSLLSQTCERMSHPSNVTCPLCPGIDAGANGGMRPRRSENARDMILQLSTSHGQYLRQPDDRDVDDFNTGMNRKEFEKTLDWVKSLPEYYEDLGDHSEESSLQEQTPEMAPLPTTLSSVGGTQLKRHLAQHLERLALFAILPSRHMDDDTKSVDTANALGHSTVEENSVSDEEELDDSPDKIYTVNDIIRDPSSQMDELVSKVKRWTKICDHSHDRCRKARSAESYTISLIEIGESPEQLRLVEMSSVKAPRYTFISFDWDETSDERQKSNIEDLKVNIPFEDLKQGEKDAICLTYRLGIRHILIDPLCVFRLPDDEHISTFLNLHNVVANAYLVMGTRDANMENSLLRQRTDAQTHEYANYQSYPAPAQLQSTTFIDKLLGRRILLFEPSELVWQCKTIHRCECQAPSPSPSSHPSYESWYTKVCDYSRTHIVPEVYRDRLGIWSHFAKTFTSSLASEYHAGLWKNDAIPGLLWRTLSPLQIPDGYVAPSWSWASVNGPIHYGHCRQQIAHATSMESTLTDDEFPEIEVLHGLVTVRCVRMVGVVAKLTRDVDIQPFSCSKIVIDGTSPPRFRITHTEVDDDIATEQIGDESLREGAEDTERSSFGRQLDEEKLGELKGDEDVTEGFSSLPKAIDARIHFDYVDDLSEAKEDGMNCHCVWLAYRQDQSTSDILFSGLILMESENEVGRFERIGLVDVLGPEEELREWVGSFVNCDQEDVTIV